MRFGFESAKLEHAAESMALIASRLFGGDTPSAGPPAHNDPPGVMRPRTEAELGMALQAVLGG